MLVLVVGKGIKSILIRLQFLEYHYNNILLIIFSMGQRWP